MLESRQYFKENVTKENVNYVYSSNAVVDQKKEIRWYATIKMKDADYYGAAWLMPVGAFVRTRVDKINLREDAVHHVFRQHKS